jgi:glycosyltransferase involved in cell wall biosynthesis
LRILGAVDTRPLHILQSCFSPSWGGLELQALEVSRRLAARGHRVTLACTSGSRLESEARAASLGVLALRVSGYLHPGAIRAIARFLRRERVDIIHCQHSKDIATIVPARILSRRAAPILLSKRVGSYLMKRDVLHRFTYAHVDRILAISEVIRRNVIETTPAPADRVVTLHDAVDLDRFNPAAADRQRVRAEFGAGSEALLIGFVGRFSPGKGHEEFLAAAAELAPRHAAMRFVIVGEASRGEEGYASEIRRTASGLGLDGVVRFAGFRTDVPDVLAAFDIFAFPSHAEAFGVVLIEAMAMERPVVSTNCDGVLDIVVDGETGIFVPPKDAPALAAALARLAAEPALRAEMGRAGRRRVERLFDQRAQTDAIERHYRELLGRQASR